uniref:Uncharacterized protein n=1 Tax=Lactuca sativa TaxID=4236 RepID=A0A9R1UEL3_LACSA|nr:hypothetical protein LSAT_V11C900467480 [Lactuca sativa]
MALDTVSFRGPPNAKTQPRGPVPKPNTGMLPVLSRKLVGFVIFLSNFAICRQKLPLFIVIMLVLFTCHPTRFNINIRSILKLICTLSETKLQESKWLKDKKGPKETKLKTNNHEESFNNLSVYLHNLRRTNTHTYTHIKIDLMDRFEACLWLSDE